jgi:hypothetical protein
MANENLLSSLEQTLNQSQMTRNRLAGKLAELESEADSIRAQLFELDNIIAHTRSTMVRLVSSVPINQPRVSQQPNMPSDVEIEAAMARDMQQSQSYHQPLQQRYNTYHPPMRHDMPPIRSNIEQINDRFTDRTIPQAVTMLLREEAGPLHVNEIYNRLCEGGFSFTGNNPTISIAVSLNRNPRFRKVAPGTFDLVIREASANQRLV